MTDTLLSPATERVLSMSQEDPMWGALEGHSACEASGWCAKNHGGSPLAVSSKRRFVTSEGFWVMYWDKEDENHRVRCGRFDLRNVIELRHSKDPAATAGNALDVRISTAEKMSDAKLLTFTFETDAARWRTLWASAVAKTSLSSELGAVRDASLARTLDQQFADQAHLKASAFTRGSLHSPRVAPGLERLDTPRATPLGQAARRASAPEPAPGEAPPTAMVEPAPAGEVPVTLLQGWFSGFSYGGQSLEEISVDGEAPAPEPETIEERLKRAAAARELQLQQSQNSIFGRMMCCVASRK